MKLTAFNRPAIIAEIRDIFKPLEGFLKLGDTFDYDHLFFASGHINGTWEQVVIVPLAEGSVSIAEALSLGEGTLWKDITPLPLHGFYAIPPIECFRDIEADTPYLVQARGWGEAEMVNVNGEFVRTCEIHWVRPIGWETPYFKLSGNIIMKGLTCSSVSSNQA